MCQQVLLFRFIRGYWCNYEKSGNFKTRHLPAGCFMKKLFLCLLCLLPLQAAYAQRIERSFPAPVPAGLSTMIALTASDGQNRQNPQPVSWLPYGLPNGNEALAGVKTARRVDVYSYGAQNQWVFSSANAYTFNAAGLVGTYVGFYPGPADSSSLVYYTYNNRGQPLCYLRKIRTRSGLWHNDSRTNYEYDTFGNTVAYGAAYYDTLINQFINFDSASTTYTYSAGSVFTKRRIWRINSYNRPWVIIDSVLTSGPIGEPLELIERNSSSAPLKMLYSGWFNWVPPPLRFRLPACENG